MAQSPLRELSCGGISLDYSKNLITAEVFAALLAFAEDSPLATLIEAMFKGEAINSTEQRGVLHTALRASSSQLQQDGLASLSADIAAEKQRMATLSHKIRKGQWLGSTGKRITDVVNLGIGGSDLGPKLVCEALKEYKHPNIHCHFVANVDGEAIDSTLKALNPETTLVIIASKTFTTQETLLNANAACLWFKEHLCLENPYQSNHFMAVTASAKNAQAMGIHANNILGFWDWVGGRYSLWSAIGFSIAIAVGYDNFEELLLGARHMDSHFRTSPYGHNMPVIMALLGLWYNSFLGWQTHGVMPYCERLGHFPFYLQQLDMESNGKGTRHNGEVVTYNTGPILWGLTGSNGQHSFFQLLHQGTHKVPVDFIGIINDNMGTAEHQRVLLANMLAQSAALMLGKQDSSLPSYRNYDGNRPSNVLLLDSLTPKTLGGLIALYEHKVFVQGCLLNINSFDQWGVELGKVLARSLLASKVDYSQLDKSTAALLAKIAIDKEP